MQSDFAEHGRLVMESLAVPEVPLATIRRRSRAARSLARAQAVVALILVLCAAGTGVSLGAKIYDGMKVWLSGSKAALVVDSFTMLREPMDAEFRAIIARATFPVVLPVGLPQGTHIARVFFAPADHPSTLTVEYVNDHPRVRAGFTLLDPAIVNVPNALLPTGSTHTTFHRTDTWRAGNEVVLIPRGVLAEQQLRRIRAAMVTTTPAASLAENEAGLSRIVMLGGSVRIALAERYRSGSASSVLVDPDLKRSIPRLAALGKPMLDGRRTFVSNIRYVNGEPDYRKARGTASDAVAIPATGVRAIAAVLRDEGSCVCEVLYRFPRHGISQVWLIPVRGLADVRSYAVDERDERVTPDAAAER